jgi:hypothetical protein
MEVKPLITSVDPITFEILSHRLYQIAKESEEIPIQYAPARTIGAALKFHFKIVCGAQTCVCTSHVARAPSPA